MKLLSGGKVTLEGVFVPYGGVVNKDANTIITTPANGQYYYELIILTIY